MSSAPVSPFPYSALTVRILTTTIPTPVVISDRLVTSPCAIVADASGFTANVQRMMSASNNRQTQNPMYENAKRQKVLEINPKSPLIQGLLRRVEQLPGEDEERDIEAEEELKEVTSILIDGALVRSGFEVADSDEYVCFPQFRYLLRVPFMMA